MANPRPLKRTSAFLALIISAGCYHTTISTGVAPSPGQIRDDWADGWFWGAIGPKTIWTPKACPHGVSLIETERSAGNLIVSFLTIGYLHTDADPDHLRDRAAARRDLVLPREARRAPPASLPMTALSTPTRVKGRSRATFWSGSVAESSGSRRTASRRSTSPSSNAT